MNYILYDKKEQSHLKLGSGYEAPALLVTNKDLYLFESNYYGDTKTKLDNDRFELRLDEQWDITDERI